MGWLDMWNVDLLRLYRCVWNVLYMRSGRALDGTDVWDRQACMVVFGRLEMGRCMGRIGEYDDALGAGDETGV